MEETPKLNDSLIFPALTEPKTGQVPELPDNRHIVIPLMTFVFGFPVFVITILCIIQQRNRWIMQREITYLRQQRLSSTMSTVYTGMPLTNQNQQTDKRRASELCPIHKSSLPPPYDHHQRSQSTAIPFNKNKLSYHHLTNKSLINGTELYLSPNQSGHSSPQSQNLTPNEAREDVNRSANSSNLSSPNDIVFGIKETDLDEVISVDDNNT